MEPHAHRDDGAAPGFEQVADQSQGQAHRGGMHGERDSTVVEMAGEFGAELVRAIRVDLAQGASSAYGPRGPSQLSWYAFAVEYARAHWPGRAAKTRDEVSDALTAITLAMLWDVPGRPNEQVLRCALRRWVFAVPGPEERELPVDCRPGGSDSEAVASGLVLAANCGLPLRIIVDHARDPAPGQAVVAPQAHDLDSGADLPEPGGKVLPARASVPGDGGGLRRMRRAAKRRVCMRGCRCSVPARGGSSSALRGGLSVRSGTGLRSAGWSGRGGGTYA